MYLASRFLTFFYWFNVELLELFGIERLCYYYCVYYRTFAAPIDVWIYNVVSLIRVEEGDDVVNNYLNRNHCSSYTVCRSGDLYFFGTGGDVSLHSSVRFVFLCEIDCRYRYKYSSVLVRCFSFSDWNYQCNRTLG